jgi:hypothetical protein
MVKAANQRFLVDGCYVNLKELYRSATPLNDSKGISSLGPYSYGKWRYCKSGIHEKPKQVT